MQSVAQVPGASGDFTCENVNISAAIFVWGKICEFVIIVLKMPKSCCVHGCTANKKSYPDRQFYIIPSEKTRREKWLAVISRAVLNADGSVNKSKRWSPRSGQSYVCSAHFVTGQYCQV